MASARVTVFMFAWIGGCTLVFGFVNKMAYRGNPPTEVVALFGYLSLAILLVPVGFFAVMLVIWNREGSDGMESLALVPACLVMLVVLTFLSICAMHTSRYAAPPLPSSLIQVAED